jgi:hypothetical protein
MVLVTVACVQMATTFKVDLDGGVLNYMAPPVPPGTHPAKDGAQIWELRLSKVGGSNVNVQGDFTFQVAFNYPGLLENRPVLEVLVQMGQAVIAVIKELCPDFEP